MKAGASDSLMTLLSSCLLAVLLFSARYVLDQRYVHSTSSPADNRGRAVESRSTAESRTDAGVFDDSEIEASWEQEVAENTSP